MEKLATGIGVALLAGALFVPALCTLLYYCLVAVCAISIGAFSAIWAHLYLSSEHRAPPPGLLDDLERALHELRDGIGTTVRLSKAPPGCGRRTSRQSPPVVFGRTVDGLLRRLVELALRDFLLAWLGECAHEPRAVVERFEEDLWGAVQDLHERARRVQADKLIACDMTARITAHFERIRLAQAAVFETNKPAVFAVSPYLMNPQAELQYVRQLSELFIMFLLPRCYSLAPASYLLREILACKILYPAIQMVTEPDYINQKILNYLEAQHAAAAVHSKTLEYAKSFEDFLKLIQSCNDVDKLKQIRSNIVSEIMQATTLQNVNRARGIEVDENSEGGITNANKVNPGNVGAGKRQIAAARKLKKYILQLSYAKGQCEAKLTALGWDGPFPLHDADSAKILPLNKILENVLGRRHLSMFLETLFSQGLVGYWLAVEELRSSCRSNWHQLGAEIFYTYIRSPTAEIKVDKETRKRMEAFLLGDKGPEVFYEVQQMVLNTLHDKYYQPFLISDQYKKLLKDLSEEEESNGKKSVKNSPMEERQFSGDSMSSSDSAVGTLNLGEHSSYARKKLEQLQERLNNKTQALRALQASLKPESKLLEMLRKEVVTLTEERHRVEAHISRANAWAQHLGKWRATVHNAEIEPESQLPQFVLVVHIDEPSKDDDSDERDGISTGWVLLRTLANFQELHRKLRPICSEIKNLELPSNTFKFLFSKTDKTSLEKAKSQIQKYLEFILEDEHLNQSEAIYAFLSPSSEHLKNNIVSPKKSRFSFSTLFKSGSENSHGSCAEFAIRESNEDEDISSYLDGGDSGDPAAASSKSSNLSNASRNILGADDGKDAIAEPLYALMGEVFDMRGVFKWLRKTLISFVQITYGRTINRQIRDTISWMFSEPMLHYYISLVMKSWWPGGVLAKPPEARSQKVKDETRKLAHRQFVNNVPDVLNNLMGVQSAQRGAEKIFDTLQNHTLNKQLFYNLFELLLIQVFPELKQHL